MPEGRLQRLSFRLCIDLSLGEPCRVIASSTIRLQPLLWPAALILLSAAAPVRQPFLRVTARGGGYLF